MKKIAIDTTQNVKIEYELAELRDRVLAFLLDFLILMVSLSLCSILFTLATFGDIFFYFVYVLQGFIFFFYTPLSEILMDGQTLGKKALNIKVVKITGKKPQVIDYLTRWAFRCIDLYGSLGAIAGVLVATTEKAQRIGGMVSNTAVVRLDPRMHLSLNQLLNIDTIENYTPKHTRITMLNDKDMLIIKRVLDRAINYANPAHLLAIDKTLAKVKESTGIECKEPNKLEFLRTLLKDYIVLTR